MKKRFIIPLSRRTEPYVRGLPVRAVRRLVVQVYSDRAFIGQYPMLMIAFTYVRPGKECRARSR